MPYSEEWYPDKKKRKDAKIGNTSAWEVVERAKEAGVSSVQDWRRNKTIGSAADNLRCYDGVNAIKEALEERIRKKKLSH
jgi:hypothetical protein